MSEAVEEKKKSGWWKGLRKEWKKIIWPDKKSVFRQTVSVIIISVILGIIIKVLDMLIQAGIGAIS